MPLTIKTVVFNAVLGLAAGFATLPLLGNTFMCCCGSALVPVVAAFLGSFLVYLLLDPANPPGSVAFSGVMHGILVGLLSVVAVGAGLLLFTSDQAVVRVASQHLDHYRRLQQTYIEQLEKEADSDKLSEEEREKLRKQVEALRSQTAEQEKLLDKVRKDPSQIRSSVLVALLFYNLVATALVGLLGGLAGKRVFRSRFLPRPGGPGDAGADGSGFEDGERMNLPEQPPGWWEKK